MTYGDMVKLNNKTTDIIFKAEQGGQIMYRKKNREILEGLKKLECIF